MQNVNLYAASIFHPFRAVSGKDNEHVFCLRLVLKTIETIETIFNLLKAHAIKQAKNLSKK